MSAAVATAVAGGVQGAGSYFAAQAGADANKYQADRQLEMSKYGVDEQKRQFNITNPQQQQLIQARKQAYEKMLGTGAEQLQGGEQAFMQASQTASPALQQLQKDIMSRNTESMQSSADQLRAQLAQSGVRGGQAATLLGRSIGKMGTDSQREINQLIGTEAQQREAELRAYLAAKAGRGQTATLQQGAF